MIKSNYVKSKKQYKVNFELSQERIGENRDVRVLGNFNDWNWENGIQLKAGKEGYSGNTELPAGHYQFRYLVDQHHWANDDHAEAYADSGHGTTNCCFSLDQVTEEKKAPTKKAPAKKAPAKKASAKKTDSKNPDKIEAADSAPATKPVTTPQGKAKTTKADRAAPAKKSPAQQATKAKGDDLKKIEGVGPKIAGLLNEAGINTFSDLSKASEKQLADVLQEAGARFRLAKSDTWAEQAKLAAAGKMDELKKMQDSLKGGRK